MTRSSNTKRSRKLTCSTNRAARLELLEYRLLLSATDPSGDEEQTLALINRMRQNPAAELSLLENSTDPEVQSAIKFFMVDESVLATQWATLTPAPPLAWNSDLAAAALGHDQLMLADNSQMHQLPGESDLQDRVTAAGYTNFSSLRESIFIAATSVFDAHASFAIDFGDNPPTGIQNPPGHRENIMATDVDSVGIASISGPGDGDGTEAGPLVFTEDFGSQMGAANPFILGNVYTDTNQDGFYTSGEGLGGVSVHIVNISTSATFDTTTLTAGGYQVQVPPGLYSVTFSGSSLAAPTTISQLVVGSSNVEQDLSATTGFAALISGTLNVSGTNGADTITATTSGSNIIVALNGAQDSFPTSDVTELIIHGFGGADNISVDPSVSVPALLGGGGGSDTILAGSGRTTLKGNGGSDSLVGGSGSCNLNGGTGSDTLAASNGASFMAGVLSVQGTSGADTISLTTTGASIAVTADGAADSFQSSPVQSIVIRGSAGGDSISLNSSINAPALLVGGGGPDTLIGGAGRDTLKGGGGPDSILGGSGGDVLNAGAGINHLTGGSSNDVFQAINNEPDTIIGGGGNDTAHVDLGLDSVTGVNDILSS